MPRLKGLSIQIAVPFAMFVMVGSLVLTVWLFQRDRRDSREAFRTLAEANANFVERSNLPPSPQLAESLSEILELEVRFATAASPFGADVDVPDRAGEVIAFGDGEEAILVAVKPGVDALFVRKRAGYSEHLLRGSTLAPLAAFWALSLVLAAVISRKLVRPIRSLADGVGALESTEGVAASFPGACRVDEIGQLSRALTESHRRLIEERARREEGERHALLGKMATGLAHEIRNPVAAVRLHAQLLTDCERCGASGKIITAEADAVEGLVNQWMFLSKPEPPETREQDLSQCLSHCLETLAPAAAHAGVEVQCDIAGDLRGEADAARLGQAFRNIALNAIHAMPDGGTLKVVGRRIDGSLDFRFVDSGAGFSSEALERYGELFFSTKEGGMGVGLSVSSEIVAAHGGQLTVANCGGGGAEVCVRLPAAQPTES